MLNSEDYEVGYGKTPKASQFKPGHSGNPNGRPKKTKDFEKLVAEELDQTVEITENGEKKIVTKRETIVKGLINDAMKGDYRSRMQVLKIDSGNKEPEPLEVDDGDLEAINTWIRGFDKSLDPENEETNDEY